MRKLTDNDLREIISINISGYKIIGVSIKHGDVSDADHYGIVLGQNEHGRYVTWQFHLNDDEKPDVYWGHYHQEDREAAVKDFNDRVQTPPIDTAPALSTEYWDCECETRYIHHNSVDQCPICGARREHMPDSRVDEVGEGIHFAEA